MFTCAVDLDEEKLANISIKNDTFKIQSVIVFCEPKLFILFQRYNELKWECVIWNLKCVNGSRNYKGSLHWQKKLAFYFDLMVSCKD